MTLKGVIHLQRFEIDVLFPGTNGEWSFITCPLENECETNHHHCYNISEECVDQSEGYACRCSEGYEYNDG